MASALSDVGWTVVEPLGRGGELSHGAFGVDALVISTPDDSVGSIAQALIPNPETVVLHMSGSLGLDVLSGHARRATCHPLVPLPNQAVGARRLRSGCTFAISGDRFATEIVDALGGRAITLRDDDRATYHAAACIASNHVVALLGQVERIASSIGLRLDDFLGLAAAAIDDARELGPAAALTGPASRGDAATLNRHREAIAPQERGAYDAGVRLASQLASQFRSQSRKEAETLASADELQVPIYSIEDYLPGTFTSPPARAASAGN